MRVVVVGAGAWGLPTAAQLALRGHAVTLVDRYGVGNDLSSSRGPSRIWRLADPDPVRTRLAIRSVGAMERLQQRSGETVFLRRGLLWRDSAASHLSATIRAEGVEHELVDADDVGRFFPGLRPDGRAAVWQPEAGVVLADVSLRAQLRLFEGAGGELIVGPTVVAVHPGEAPARGGGPRVELDEGSTVAADAVVVAAGPGSEPLLRGLGIPVPLAPRLEQVVHFGDPAAPTATDAFPSFIDGAFGDGGAAGSGDDVDADDDTGIDAPIYAMATPGRGYKIGLDAPVRAWSLDDRDREPDAARTATLLARLRRDMPSITPRVLDAQVCSWTGSPDGSFLLDRLPGGVVIAAGDSGKGFKYSALMGELLADLVELDPEAPVDADVAALSSARFA